jgi:hypothetical protein
MSLPTEARDGLMRAWLEVLHRRHPDVSWVAVNPRERKRTTTKRKQTAHA